MTPTPTQAQLDEATGGKDHKTVRPKAPEAVPPFPSQKENDEMKCAALGTTLEKENERREAEKKAASSKGSKSAPEDMTPTPTQEENDAAKKAVMYQPEDNPGTGTDPQKTATPKSRHVEAAKPSGYNTRSTEAKSE
jgi:hypothetical protein